VNVITIEYNLTPRAADPLQIKRIDAQHANAMGAKLPERIPAI
jgi:hypothetical protein